MLFDLKENNLKAKDAIKAAGVDWEVNLEPMYWNKPGDGLTQIKDKFLVRRQPDGLQLGVVGKKYKPVQNIDAFNFMDSLIEDGSMKYEAGGYVKNGEKIFLQASIGQSEIVPGDLLNKYLVLFNTHNGSGMLRVLFVVSRLFCANQAPAILRNQKNEGLSVRHTASIDGYLADQKAKEILGIANKQFDEYDSFLKHLTNIQMNTDKVEVFINKLLPEPPKDKTKALTIRNKKKDKIIELFESGQGNEYNGVKGTAWGMYNAITEYLNYETPIRAKTDQQKEEKRFENNVFGTPLLLSRANNLLQTV